MLDFKQKPHGKIAKTKQNYHHYQQQQNIAKTQINIGLWERVEGKRLCKDWNVKRMFRFIAIPVFELYVLRILVPFVISSNEILN